MRPEAEARKAEGDGLLARGALDAAADAYRAALALAPDFFQAWANLGNVEVARGAHAAGVRCYREAIRVRPDIAELHDNLGNALRLDGDLGAALAAHEQALALKPDLAAGQLNLAVVLRAMGYLERALAAADVALRLLPGHPTVHFNRGLIQQGLGRWASARASYREALALAPAMTEVRFALAGLAILEGDKDAARAALEALRGTHGSDLNWLLLHARLVDDDSARDDAIARIEARLALGGASAEAARRAHFTLGDLLDRRGRHDAAFHHYRMANGLNRGGFDRDEYRAYVDALIATYARSRAVVSDNGSAAPVFIVGMPRSGTSLVEQILAAHPDVHADGEREAMFGLLGDLDALDDPTRTASLDRAALNRLADAYLRTWAGAADGAARLTDKMPANYEQLGLIARLFPHARVIHCVRDPADTGLSCYFQDFAGGNPWADDLDDIAQTYREYRRLMAFWAENLPLEMLEVRYEDVVDDLETQARRLLGFLDLDWHPGCLEFHASTRRARTASNQQVDQPIYRRALQRWRHYAAHVPALMALREPDVDQD